MSYYEYILEDGSSLLIETTDIDAEEPVINASRDINSLRKKIGNSMNFNHALISAKKSVQAMRSAFEESKADEVEVKFGLKATGELGGTFLIAKGGIEANYEVTLKWTKKQTSKTKKPSR